MYACARAPALLFAPDAVVCTPHCVQGFAAALGAVHQRTVAYSIALALLLAQTEQLGQAAALYRIRVEGPQLPHTFKDARALVALLRERGEEADAAALERAFSLLP